MSERIQFLDNWKAIDVGTWIADHLSFLPSVTLASHGDHLPTTGAEAMLSEHLDDLDPPFNTSGR